MRTTSSHSPLAARSRDTRRPCRLFCLDPIEGMIVGLAPGAAVEVEETLCAGGAGRVRVREGASAGG
jgi:hypothetical protein